MHKKLLSLVLALVMSLSLCIPAFALTDEESIAAKQIQLTPDSFNEYDYIIKVRRMNNMQLKSLGIPSEESAYIDSNAVESEFQYRATLPEDVLRDNYGYSDEAISVLKKYDGSRLEDCPEMRVAAGTLSAGMQSLISEPTRMGVLYSWSWNQLPAATHSDIVAMAWEGTYANGGSNNAAIDNRYSFANVNYYFDSDLRQESLSISSKNEYNNVSTQVFPVSKFINNKLYWAKSGNMYIYMDLVDVNGPKFVELAAHAEYGHYTFLGSVGVNFPLGLSISFTGSVNPCGAQNIRMRA